LEQKVKNLQNESKSLNYENLKIKLEILENEIKNSKFANFFQERLQALRVVLTEKSKENVNCSALESKVNSINDKLTAQDVKMSTIEEKLVQISDAIAMINKNYEDMNRRFKSLINALDSAFSAGQ
jgi:predicted  nucleic acid-binding Zn-ribbon protein